jgi:hypothetical protein
VLDQRQIGRHEFERVAQENRRPLRRIMEGVFQHDHALAPRRQ